MPLLLSCDELGPGMQLSEALTWHGRVLLTGGKVLTHADIDILCRNYPNVRVRIGDPILDGVADFEDDSHDRKVAATAQQQIAEAMAEVNERYASRASLSAMDFNAMRESVADVMDYLRNNPVSAALLSRSLDTGSYLADRAGNVFYLSMVLGSAVRDLICAERRRKTAAHWMNPKMHMDLLPLGLGAMLCDVGMLELQHVLTSSEPLSEEDWEAIRKHPDAGAEMLPSECPPVARAVIRTHHENYGGCGYPSGLKDNQIHIFSRIVRIADAYDAATATHVYKAAKSPVRALWEMSVGPYGRFYDPTLRKVFTRLIQPFPIGAKLRLGDGRHAVVVSYNRQDSFKPTVVIAFDAEEKRLPDSALEPAFCLADREDLQVQSFGGEDLGFLYDPTPDDQVVPAQSPPHSLFETAYP